MGHQLLILLRSMFSTIFFSPGQIASHKKVTGHIISSTVKVITACLQEPFWTKVGSMSPSLEKSVTKPNTDQDPELDCHEANTFDDQDCRSVYLGFSSRRTYCYPVWRYNITSSTTQNLISVPFSASSSHNWHICQGWGWVYVFQV